MYLSDITAFMVSFAGPGRASELSPAPTLEMKTKVEAPSSSAASTKTWLRSCTAPHRRRESMHDTITSGLAVATAS